MEYVEEKNDRPTWTLFFEGTLYRRYLQYLKHHDLSQMLNNGTTLTSSYGSAIPPPTLTHETSWLPPRKYDAIDNEMPPPYPSRYTPRSSVGSEKHFDYKTIQKRTRWLVCVGITSIALVAAIVALVIHYMYIEGGDEVSNREFINIPGNFTANKTLHLLQENETNIIGQSDRIRDDQITLSSVSKDVGSGSFWRKDPFTTTTTKRPKLVLLQGTRTDTEDEWHRTSPERPPLEPIVISEVVSNIGAKDTSITCTIHTVDWDYTYLTGNNVAVNFTKYKTLKSKGCHSRLSCDFDFKNEANIKEIRLIIGIKDVKCIDQGMFVCGLVDKKRKVEKQAKLTVTRKPTSVIIIKSPIGIVEGQAVELEATWKGGYPIPSGNISWFYTNNNTSGLKPFQQGDISWRMKTRRDRCNTYINSIVKFVPTMEMNGTILHAVVTDNGLESEDNHTQIIEDKAILVIPGTYCGNERGDVYKPNPYTCKKFVRCRHDRIDVYYCPENMCFSEKLSQCKLLKTVDK